MRLTVSHQTTKNVTVNREKEHFFVTVNRQRKQLPLSANGFKVFQISLFQLLMSDCWLSKNLFFWYNYFSCLQIFSLIYGSSQ